MKLSSVRHLIKEGFKNVWDNRLMSLASIGVLISCMVLIGAVILVSFNVDRAVSNIEEQNVIMAYLNDYNSVKYSDEYVKSSTTASGSEKETVRSEVPEDEYLVHNDEEALAVCDEIKHIPNVKSVEYISAEEGIKRVTNMINKDQAEYIKQLESEGENPLSCAAQITLEDLSLIEQTIGKIQKVDGVHTVSSQLDVAKKVTSIKGAINTASYVIIGMLMIIALVIVCNTIRVTMFNRKLEISIMKAVGATDAFIRLPFVVEGIVIGLISAILTLGILYVGYSAVLNAMVSTLQNPVAFSDHILLFVEIFAGVGVLFGLIGSVFMINKYLKKEGSEFSALS